MTAIQQQAIQLIRRLPDEKVLAIITLASDEIYLSELQKQSNVLKKETAFAQLESMDISFADDFDPQEELADALEEKYGITC